MQTTHDFDALIDAIRLAEARAGGENGRAAEAAGTPDDGPLHVAWRSGPASVEEQKRFWKALFDLTHWHFYTTADPQRTIDSNQLPRPFVGVVNGVPMLHVFTDNDRAVAFAQNRHRLMNEPDRPIAVLATAPEPVVGWLWQMRGHGVLLFVNLSYLGDVANLPWLYALGKGVTIDEACAQMGIDPAAPGAGINRPADPADPLNAPLRSASAAASSPAAAPPASPAPPAPPPSPLTPREQRKADRQARMDEIQKWAEGDGQPAKPMPLIGRLIGLVFFGVFFWFGLMMVQSPGASPLTPKGGGGGATKGRLLVKVLDWLWSAPVGWMLMIIAGLFIVILLTAGWKKGKDVGRET